MLVSDTDLAVHAHPLELILMYRVPVQITKLGKLDTNRLSTNKLCYHFLAIL